jgi:hypothetical protein
MIYIPVITANDTIYTVSFFLTSLIDYFENISICLDFSSIFYNCVL